ncbi:hypothetical protein HNQ35_002823 [Cerasibacillus quisquiliarum]|uniref:Uncharacterized protein n=1 Tax=Cerasibacillus quisquiliarum TaxID=227865 RepID=A0A511V0R5_9BACI|nr:hypothetical protein [Cerasibacillus quisquiliarum]MBB5147594.1 hypothetical protein [Cerasibacillus quisquiliarum]GEN32496.1 hypothetical protein CQU01_27340 [Cerasibacillus quisquiliarum]
MDNNNIWVPLLASVGVGAATYYTMTRQNQGFGQTMQKMLPLVSEMTNMKNDSQTFNSHDMS